MMVFRWCVGQERMVVARGRAGKTGQGNTSITLLSLSPEKNPTSTPTIRYSHRRCRFRLFRAPMRTALSGSCRPMKARRPSLTDGDSSRYALSGAQSTLTSSLVSRVVDGTVSCHCFFFSLPFLESRGPGTALLTVPWLSQWIAGPLHNASG